jgi:hypothetical protein
VAVPTPRISWIQHGGTRVLGVDLRSSNREDQIQMVEAYTAALGERPDERLNVLVLGDAGVEYFPDMSTRLKAVMALQEKRIRRSALVGFGGIARVAFDSALLTARLLGKDVHGRGRHFDAGDREAALNWLVEP